MSVLSILSLPLALLAILLFAITYGVALCTYPHEPTPYQPLIAPVFIVKPTLRLSVKRFGS